MYKKVITSLLLLCALSTNAYGPYHKEGTTTDKTKNSLQTKAANCAPSTSTRFLEYNNVRCIIETAGFMWLNRSTSRASYEVPKGDGRTTIYSGALWMGGTTSGGILKVAAHLFRQGNDFWAGPLTTKDAGDGVSTFGYGDGQIEPNVCNQYDRFWVTEKTEVLRHYVCVSINDATNCPSDYKGIPESIRNWPGNYIDEGSKYVDYFLAPFVDWNGDEFYNANDGDYPGYDLFKKNDCPKPRGGRVDLYGDHNIWYVFNDRGNIHTETGGESIGMEVKAQAFAFATSDEINSMTFYNYEMINRSTTTLYNTYFGQACDADLGCYGDDYAGCDVQRGFGYIYNGQAVDGAGGVACQGTPWNDGTPPAIGIDFFEGPYQDNDGKDNPLTTNVALALAEGGIPYKGIGIGYGDGVVDNERFGMSRFVYFNGFGAPIGAVEDPQSAAEYYNFMRGIWRDGSQFVFGGIGHISNTSNPNGSNVGVGTPTKYVFPDDSDPLFWGTEGIPTGQDWTEAAGGNTSGDRRFFQSAGPFTLLPGAYNNITVGVVYARAASGNPFQSVELVRVADDKAQKLFDNCFRLIDGPDAPDVEARELDKEIILYLTNTASSNNYKEGYIEQDPSIALDPARIYLDTVPTSGVPWADPSGTGYDVGGDGLCDECYYRDDTKYRFQGYQIFQLANASVSAQELDDISKARIVSQCDVKDGVTRLVNFEFNAEVGAAIPIEKVVGADKGIVHTVQVKSDQFAQGDNKLVNYKKYYYMVVAYAYNNYRQYNPTDPLFLDGQKLPYLRGRKSTFGTIPVITAIPHKPIAGTVLNSDYGDTPLVIREEGRGNGGLDVEITEESEQQILANGYAEKLVYKKGSIPIDFKIVDPLKVPNDEFEIRFFKKSDLTDANENAILFAKWALISRTTKDTVWSDTTISFKNEQLLKKSFASKFNSSNEFVSIDWGFSISIAQPTIVNSSGVTVTDNFPTPISSTITYSDSTKPWLTGIPDSDAFLEYNWIRAGAVERTTTDCDEPADYPGDNGQMFEKILNGTWGPFSLLATGDCFGYAVSIDQKPGKDLAKLSDLTSVDIVFTSDKSKWTRAAVIEMQRDNVWTSGIAKGRIKSASPSRDKEGRKSGDAGYNAADGDFGGAQPMGMSWFPGYAIDVNTGERMNIAFGEDSRAGAHGGNDMIWNPSSDITNYGGMHYIYIFRNESYEGSGRVTPIYDEGQFLYTNLNGSVSARRNLWRSCTWVGAPLLRSGQTILASDARIRLRVTSPYKRFSTNYSNNQNLSDFTGSSNNWYPLYSFNTADLAHEEDNLDSAKSALDRINIVPNPYYAYSEYEESRLENRVKIINLPETCTIKIYNVAGNLIRTYKKDSEITFQDWDLTNHKNVPIASGMYIIHIDVPGIGEKVIKWMGVMRTPDLENL